MEKYAGLQTLPPSTFSHTNLLNISRTDAKVDIEDLKFLHVYVVFHAVPDYGSQTLIRDDFLVTWSIWVI